MLTESLTEAKSKIQFLPVTASLLVISIWIRMRFQVLTVHLKCEPGKN